MRQHRAIWSFTASKRICDPIDAAILTGRSQWTPTRHGAATAAAPRHLGFCSSAGNPRLGPPHSSAAVGERWPPFTVVPRWPYRPIWSFTESPRIRSSMQRAGFLRSTLHFAPRIERFQSFYPRNGRRCVTTLAGILRAVILRGHAPICARLARLVLLFGREARFCREDQRLLCLRAELMLGEQRPRDGHVGSRVRYRSRCESAR